MMKEHNPTPNYEDTTFIGLWKHDKLEPFCFPFWVAISISIVAFVLDLFYLNFTISTNIFDLNVEFFSLAVSSLGINLAALAIVLILYNDDLKKLAFEQGAYQQFLFPYYINAYSWTCLSLISLLTIIVEDTILVTNFIDIIRTMSYILLFLIIYSLLYTIRIIGSIISNSILDIFSK